MKLVGVMMWVLVGCAHDQQSMLLADIPGLEADVDTRLTEDPSHRAFQEIFIVLQYDDMATEGCAVLASSFTATVNDVAMDIVQRGRNFEGDCYKPSLSVEVTPEMRRDRSTIELTDDSTTLTYDLGDALVERTATPVGSATPWAFHVGDTATVQWSPASDLAKYSLQVSYAADAFTTPAWSFRADTTGADTVSFAIRDGGPPSGVLTLAANAPVMSGPGYTLTLSLRADESITVE